MTEELGRRAFLKAAGAGALVAGLDAKIAAAQGRFQEAMEAEIGRNLQTAYDLADGLVYFNHASIGTIPRAVQAAHRRYLDICETNPWAYMWGGEWEAPREALRRAAAGLFGAPADNIAITHNTTEGFNIAAGGLALGPGDEVLFSSLNHPGASQAWNMRAAERGFDVRRFDFPAVDVPHLTPDDMVEIHIREIGDRTRVLVLPHVDNIFGITHPVAEIARKARQMGVTFIAVDGAQCAGMMPLDLAAMNVDLYATSGHKWLQGPKGTGLLYLSDHAREVLRPMWVTWGQERWAGTVRIFEDYGTRNFPAILALADAIGFQNRVGANRKSEHYAALRDRARQMAASTPGLAWRSPQHPALVSALYAVAFEREAPGVSFARLREKGYNFRAFRVPEPGHMRLSPNLMNTTEQLDRFFAALIQA